MCSVMTIWGSGVEPWEHPDKMNSRLMELDDKHHC